MRGHRVVLLAALLAASSILISAQPAPPVPQATLAARVKQEFTHAWDGYKRYAWGHDELLPLTKGPRDWEPGKSLLMTPVDALDTMILMGMTEEATRTRAYIAANLDVTQDASVQVFEITIRLLGSLITNYQLTGDEALLAKAKTLADRLLPAFKSKTGMPYRFVNLKTGAVRDPVSNPAEIGTLILEFGTLSKITGEPIYYDTAKRALTELYTRRSPIGLVGENINVETGEWTSRESHIGGYIDSWYRSQCPLFR